MTGAMERTDRQIARQTDRQDIMIWVFSFSLHLIVAYQFGEDG